MVIPKTDNVLSTILSLTNLFLFDQLNFFFSDWLFLGCSGHTEYRGIFRLNFTESFCFRKFD